MLYSPFLRFFFLISILKIFKSVQNLTQGYRYYKFRKSLGSSSGHTLNFCPNSEQYRVKYTGMFQKESLALSSTLI